MTIHFDLPAWVVPVFWMIAGIALLFVVVLLVGCFQLGHMDTRYRDQIAWAWQERKMKKAQRRLEKQS